RRAPARGARRSACLPDGTPPRRAHRQRRRHRLDRRHQGHQPRGGPGLPDRRQRIVWIAGGDTKGADLEPLIASAADSLGGVVLLGTDASPSTAALPRHAPQIPVIRLDPGDTDDVAGRTRLMEEAVRSARSLASPGDVVLLAPAAASIDQFRDYADRGDLFAAAVSRLPGERQ